MYDQEHEDDIATARAAYRLIYIAGGIAAAYLLGQTVRSIGIMLGWWG